MAVSQHKQVLPLGFVSEVRYTRIRCGCGAKTREDVERLHGVDHNGALLPCPTPRAIEHLGTAEDRDELVRSANCTTWDEYQEKHPLVARLFMLRNKWKEKAASS